ncbi:MAG TPA: cell division protein ZipA C-terminal FtsZ-binding domain-containing protein [Thiobacillaceae bacterium]|nr:cell division protein ZipA C-terminal FtsZ-binding domain-containing protein [Thiobacillaceae bacterium]HNU63145.1 cell division protein ZipA C-terminal FtsZ-binding domain-containing protein [Thiobacillaceae bacterium]
MMTTLQIVLAIVGVVLIGAIVIYNLVQERRFRREAERMFSHRREDIMLGESVHAGTEDTDVRSRISLSEETPTAPEVVRAVLEAEAEYPLVGREHGPEPIGEEACAASDESGTRSTRDAGVLPDPAAVVAEEAPRGAAPESTAPLTRDLSRPPAAPALASVAVPPRDAAAAPAAVSVPPPAISVPPPAQRIPTTPAPSLSIPAVFEEGDESPAKIRDSGLDAETEYVARIRFATPSAASYGSLLSTLRRVGKPVRAFGKRLDGGWEPLTSHPRVSYDQVEIGLRLADRNGAVSHEQLDVFCRALFGFAAEEGGAVTCPDKQDALQAARSLDLLCMEVDVLIGLNVIASEARPFTSEAIHKQAEEAHMVLEADGTYHAKDAFGHTLFTLANQDDQPFPRDGRGLTVHGVTLLFDVPRVADGLAVFDRMTRLGFDLAWRLEGRLVDDNGRAVSEENLDRDRARLAAFYGRMEARGIPAGGERALRLFA